MERTIRVIAGLSLSATVLLSCASLAQAQERQAPHHRDHNDTYNSSYSYPSGYSYYEPYSDYYYPSYYPSYAYRYQYTYPQPSCSLTFSSTYYTSYGYGYQPITLSWNSSNATSAYLSPSIGAVSPYGSQTVYTYPGTIFTLTVYGPGGSNTCSTTYYQQTSYYYPYDYSPSYGQQYYYPSSYSYSYPYYY